LFPNDRALLAGKRDSEAAFNKPDSVRNAKSSFREKAVYEVKGLAKNKDLAFIR
jgi:hypothetical protein